MEIKYRTWNNHFPPKSIKLDIPGWSGDHRSHEDGATPQPWHCIPFVEASTYGLEMRYTWRTEIHAINDGETVRFQAKKDDKDIEWTEANKLPFSYFAPKAKGGHFGFTSGLDIAAPENHVVRLEPHPRFFTDETGTCPIIVPGHIHPWWQRIFFVVFKAPLPGETHIFRHGEPYGQILIVPAKSKYEVREMCENEANVRKSTETKIYGSMSRDGDSPLAKHIWKDNAGQKFDDKYKQMQILYNKGGMKAINSALNSLSYGTPHVKQVGKFIKNETLFNQKKHLQNSNSDSASTGHPPETKTSPEIVPERS